jgi:hypothetical protein
MRELALLAFLLAACSEHGSSLDASSSNSFETPRFQPFLCTGSPMDPTCAINEVELARDGAAARFTFVVQALGTGLFMSNASLEGGPQGISMHDFTLRVWETDTTPVEFPFDRVITVPPNEVIQFESRAFIIEDTTRPLSLHASAVGPFLQR